MEPKALSTFRLGIDCWQNEDTFSRWLDSLEPFRHGFDDIALFTQMTHAVLSLEILKTNLQVVPERFAALRERGFGAGLNHLCTMGFFLENRRHVPRGIPFYINADGRPNPGRLCPSTPEYREKFMRPLMHLLAATHPDFIWLDDDNNGCCMCDFCMARFNARYQTRETRESLTASLVNGSWEERIAAR